MSVCARSVEVVVVFARQRPRSSLKPVEFGCQEDRFRSVVVSLRGPPEHASNSYRKNRSASSERQEC